MTTKCCTKCGKELPLTEFYPTKKNKVGLYAHCKACHYVMTRKNLTTEEGKAKARKASLRWYHERGGKEKNRITSSSDARRESRAEYERSEAGKVSRRKQYQKRKQEKPQYLKAKNKVNNAIKRGDIPPVHTQECRECGEQAVDYHHPNYDQPLYVIPLCKKCHAETYTDPH